VTEEIWDCNNWYVHNFNRRLVVILVLTNKNVV